MQNMFFSLALVLMYRTEQNFIDNYTSQATHRWYKIVSPILMLLRGFAFLIMIYGRTVSWCLGHLLNDIENW